MHEPRPTLARRAGAALVLLVAGYVVLKVAVGFATMIAGALVLIAAVAAIVWALRVL